MSQVLIPPEILNFILRPEQFEDWPSDSQLRQDFCNRRRVCKSWKTLLDNVVVSDPEAIYNLAAHGSQTFILNHLGKLDVGTIDLDEVLYDAVCRGHEEVVRLLLEKGASPDPDTENGDGYEIIPLHEAARKGHEKVVQLLLDYGADIRYERDNRTALHDAVAAGHVGVAHLLLNRGAEITSPRWDGTPFKLAVGRQDEAVVRELIGLRTDILTSCDYRDSSIHISVQSKHEPPIKLMLENGADATVQGISVLCWAIDAHQESAVRLLLSNGVHLSSEDPDNSPLEPAAESGHEGIMQLLLDNGASVTQDGFNALRHAARLGHEAVVQVLLDNGADVFMPEDYANETPLHAGAKNHGADASVQCFRSQTPLHCAARTGQLAVVELLLAHGVDVTTKNSDQDIALHLAVANRRQEVVSLLLKTGSDILARRLNNQSVLHCAARDGDEAMVCLLIENGADIHAVDRFKRKPRFYAAEKGNETVLRLLESSLNP